MNCKRVRPKLDLLAGDDLAGRDAAEVEAHLRQCLSCYREYVELRDMIVAVRAARQPADRERTGAERESLVAGVMERIHGPPPAAPRLLPRLAMVSGWAAALVLGLTAGWFQRQLATSRAPAGGGPIIEHANPSVPTIDQRWIDQRIDSEVQSQIDELRGRTPTGTPRRVDEGRPVRRWPPKSY